MQQVKIHDLLKFLHRSKGLEAEKRYKVSLSEHQNSVAEHSWRLALMVLVIGAECKIQMNMERALTFAILHDLAEATTGDIDAQTQISGGSKMRAKKAIDEEKAMHEMTDDLLFGDWVFSLWENYEQQNNIEAKFVRALDKIEGYLHIAEVGVTAYVPKEFHADYANQAISAFDEATNHFPELKDLLDAVKQKLKTQFAKTDVQWIEK